MNKNNNNLFSKTLHQFELTRDFIDSSNETVPQILSENWEQKVLNANKD